MCGGEVVQFLFVPGDKFKGRGPNWISWVGEELRTDYRRHWDNKDNHGY